MTPEQLAALQARAYKDMAPWTAADFAGMLAQKTTLLSVSNHAFLLARVVVDEAEILSLATDPAFQRTGQARQVMQAYEAEAIKRGAFVSFLEVAEPNFSARAFYRTMGYHETGHRAAYYRQPDGSYHDAVLMTRALTQG